MKNKTMTKTIDVTIDTKTARTMLGIAGFNYEKLNEATDIEVFAKVLSMIDCYGATFIIKGDDPKGTELSYADLLARLVESVRSDAIPDNDKKEIEKHLEALQDLLWKYSA